jgi:hypothetical protein
MSSFQADFARALLAPEAADDAPMRELRAQPAFAVYRNTVMKGCIDALEANFPTVARLVGRDWFRSAAAQFVRAQPPTDARLLVYGDAGFGEFLQALPSAAELDYLAGVARLDTLWRTVHAAADAPQLARAALVADAPEALARRVLVPHPATRWAWFDHAPVASFWARNRAGTGHAEDLVWQGEGLLFTRAQGAVCWQPLARGGCAFLDACRQGWPLGEAAQQALCVDPAIDLSAVLAALLQAGAFTDSTSLPGEPT